MGPFLIGKVERENSRMTRKEKQSLTQFYTAKTEHKTKESKAKLKKKTRRKKMLGSLQSHSTHKTIQALGAGTLYNLLSLPLSQSTLSVTLVFLSKLISSYMLAVLRKSTHQTPHLKVTSTLF